MDWMNASLSDDSLNVWVRERVVFGSQQQIPLISVGNFLDPGNISVHLSFIQMIVNR
jgi:hypothetical protein